MQKFVEKNVKIIPWVLNSIFFGSLVLSLWVTIRPLYRAAVKREVDQVEAAKGGLHTALQNSLYQMSVTASLVAKDPIVQGHLNTLAQGGGGTDENLEATLGALLEYVKTARLDFMEVVSMDGKVLVNVDQPQRRGQDVKQWALFANTTESENTRGLSQVGNGVFANASALVRYEGKPVGILIAGVEIDHKWLSERSRDLTAELTLQKDGQTVMGTLTDDTGNPLLGSVFGGQGEGINTLLEKRYAVGQVELKSQNDGPSIGSVAILTSLEGFFSTLGALLRNAALILLPLAIGSTFLVMAIGRGMVAFTVKLAKLKSQLEKILVTTKELAACHGQEGALAIAMGAIAQELFGKSKVPATVKLFPRTEGAPSEPTAVAKGVFGEETGPVQWTHEPVPPQLLQEVAQGYPQWSSLHLRIPIALGEKPLGILEMEGRPLPSHGGQDDLQFASTVASSLAISLENIAYVSDSQTKAKLEAEMEAAKTVQESLLPKTRHFPGMEISTTFQSASQTGGDWYGYLYDEAEHALFFYIGDVTGHGFPSALLTGVVCGAIYSSEYTFQHLHQNKELPDQEEEKRLRRVAEVVNQVVRQTGRNRLLMTMLFVRLDLTSGKLTLLNAGHNAPYWLQQEEKKVKVVPGCGSRMGFTNEPQFSVKTLHLKQNDVFFLFTDGLIENTSPNGQVLTEKQLKELILANGTTDQILGRVMEKALGIWADNPPADDCTTLAFRWLGPVDRNAVANSKLPGGKPLVQFHHVPDLKDEVEGT